MKVPVTKHGVSFRNKYVAIKNFIMAENSKLVSSTVTKPKNQQNPEMTFLTKCMSRCQEDLRGITVKVCREFGGQVPELESGPNGELSFLQFKRNVERLLEVVEALRDV